MKEKSKTHFSGFTRKTLRFLTQVHQQNSKEWLDEHRAVYEQHLIQPFKALVTDLTPTMLQIDEWFETTPAIGKTIARLHRDTRFSKDKSRYRDRLWLTFKRAQIHWKESPAYFFELSPSGYRYGLGYYAASRSTMDVFRTEILRDPTTFLEVASCCQAPFVLVGESYKRPLKKELSPEISHWYNRKSFAVMADSEEMEPILSSQLLHQLSEDFQRLASLYAFLIRVDIMKRIPVEHDQS